MADDMTSVDVTDIGSSLAQPSLVAAFDVKATAEPDAVALRASGSDERLTWAGPGWWKLEPAEHNEPFDGCHRSSVPEILGAAQAVKQATTRSDQ
jgi:hypothetical protein